MVKKADWTFMVYMAGDNNLSSAGDADLTEMRRVGSSERVNVVVEFDNAGSGGTRRIHIQKDGSGETVEQLGETDSGSPEVLSDFIIWAAKNYPAERYALILWNHGGGWEPLEVDRIARSVDSPGYNGQELKERSSSSLGRAFFRSSLEEIFRLGSPTERAICSDDGTGHSLDTVELGKVIATAVETIGQPFDLLGMDACLMSNLEVAYQLKNHVRYMVASEENEPNQGWPYHDVLQRLITDPSAETADFACRIVTDYMNWYRKESSDNNSPPTPGGNAGGRNLNALPGRSIGRKPDFELNVTQAAMDLSKLPIVVDRLDKFARLITEGLPGTYADIWKAHIKATELSEKTLRDFGHFCKEFGQISQAPEIVEAARAVCEALKPGPGNFLVAESHSGRSVHQCTGVSIYLVPPKITEISPYYHELDFARNHCWYKFLEAYHSV